MIPSAALTDANERMQMQVAWVFLKGRLEQRDTVEWALHLGRQRNVERVAVLDVLETTFLREPWRTAWRFIEEAWGEEALDPDGASVFLKQQLEKGDRSGAAIKRIVDIVRPRLAVSAFSRSDRSYRKIPKRPRSAADLMKLSLTSGKLIDIDELALPPERDFLLELANELAAAVQHGMDIGRRLGWDGDAGFWQLGGLNRVYFVPQDKRPRDEHEPDEFHEGIAPAVKLLFATVTKLGDSDAPLAKQFVQAWANGPTGLHKRLFAAAAREERFASSNQVWEFLKGLDRHHFWDANAFPEVPEVRAVRFKDFSGKQQMTLIGSLRRGPPASQWPSHVDKKGVEEARRYWIVRELRRIEVAGGVLDAAAKTFLEEHLRAFEDLEGMDRVDEGFLGTAKAQWVAPSPDPQFNALKEGERMRALEQALTSPRRGWNDRPADRAADWIRVVANQAEVLADLEGVADAGAAFPHVWEIFGWANAPKPDAKAENNETAKRVLDLLLRLPTNAIGEALDGIAHWISSWESVIRNEPFFHDVWERIWPLTVEATNRQEQNDGKPALDVVSRRDDGEQSTLDTLNTPVGKLTGAFLRAMPERVRRGDAPFERDQRLRRMRDTIVAAGGRAGLIARYRLTESLPYFLIADPDWAKVHLLAPLLADTEEALELTRAFARRTQFTELLSKVGDKMADRVSEKRLGRQASESLVWSLTIETLHALRERREPAVPFERIQQMLRTVGEELRAHAAWAVNRFVKEGGLPGASPETLFEEAARPFLNNWWPQERQGATPGIARQFAHLPAVCGESFAEAVNTVERFLVPFDCWSMLDYGLYGEAAGEPRLAMINTPASAEALLRLLDSTIGTADGAIVPMDLQKALNQIKQLDRELTKYPSYRRLSTLARR